MATATNSSTTKNGGASSTRPSKSSNPFAYGFKVHSLSQVSQSNKPSPKKHKKSPTKSRKTQQQSSPFSTSSSSATCIELYTSSVSQLLDCKHLNTASALSLHDLQCGTATIALQAFLSYPNLRRVFGIEQNKNLFHWATKNLMSLIKNGYENSKYLLVEQIPSIKMTLAQKSSPSELEKKRFRVGQVVYCFIPLKQNKVKKRDNYQGIVKSVYDDGIHYDVEMSVTKTVATNVHRESIFLPGSERTFEICRGNLFERSDSFRSDIILLPYSISNDSFRSLLLTGCKRSPIGSRILSLSHLESWDGFASQQLRRIDANAYDNDRYETNISPHHRLYMYEHTLSPAAASSPKEILTQCTVGCEVTVRDVQQQQWLTAKVLAMNEKSKSLTVRKDGFIGDTGVEEMKIDEQRVHLIRRRFQTGDLMSCYCPKMVDNGHEDMYTLFRGQVMQCNANGTYAVQFEDGETHSRVDEIYMFSRCVHKYAEGDECVAFRYDRVADKDSDGEVVNIRAKKIARNECMIRHCNPDGSYRVEFRNIATRVLHDSFCESWLKPLDEEKDAPHHLLSAKEPTLPLLLEIDYDKIALWKPNIVSHWLSKCGVSRATATILREKHVNGVFLFDLDADLLIKQMKISQYDAVRIMQYMRVLRSKLQYNVDEEDEEIVSVSLEIKECEREIKQLNQVQQTRKHKLDTLIRAHHEDYMRYKEWELKLQCVQLSHKKVPRKDIASQLKKKQAWVNKTCKLKTNQLKKPGGSAIKQFESIQSQIFKVAKQIKEKETQKQRLERLMEDY
eukprot:493618_1